MEVEKLNPGLENAVQNQGPERAHYVQEHTDQTTKEQISVCSCGAIWSHPISRGREERARIHQAHISYFNKPKTVTL